MSEFTQGHAVVIGVGADLPMTVSDAKGFAKILTDEERCAYPPTQVTVLTEEAATREAVLAALDRLAATTQENSTVVVYFSGHGSQVESSTGTFYFLLPHGYNLSQLAKTAISGQEFMQKLAAIKAQKMLILLDCCHAGGMDDVKAPGIELTKAPVPAEAQAILAQGRGRAIIASSTADEVSLAGLPYSKFTQALIEGLAGARVAQKDGLVRLTDLALYTHDVVVERKNGRQHPELNLEQADNFAVAYYAAGETQPKGLPPEDQRREPPAGEDVGNQSGTTTIHATNTGSGGLAVGDHNKVAGARGVAADTITGDILTGDHARKINAGSYIERQDIQHNRTFDQSGQTVHGNQTNFAGDINTGGGMVNTGNIHTGGGDFIGRDRHTYGDQIQGDKITGDKVGGDKILGDKVGGDKTTVGNISGSNIAIGRGAQVRVNEDTKVAVSAIVLALQPILLAAQNAPVETRAAAVGKVQALQAEVLKGAGADDGVVAGLLDDLVKLAPDAAQAIGAAFGQPLLRAMVGPVTTFVLGRLGVG
ncbi:MAG: caspase family protein [Caldilineaceae bacterium]|nr:caspase family protein [Caldilineaceae bacterium]